MKLEDLVVGSLYVFKEPHIWIPGPLCTYIGSPESGKVQFILQDGDTPKLPFTFLNHIIPYDDLTDLERALLCEPSKIGCQAQKDTITCK